MCIAWMTFFVHAGSYFANTSLLFLAIVRPLKYRNVLTIKQSATLLVAIWSISTFFALCMGVSSATIFFPRAAPLECSVLHCQKLLGFAVVLTFSLFYMIVVSLYIAMLWRINKRKGWKQDHLVRFW
uniref:G-protein coupled receptors family 1 profile domain-containing protein n=1 Tax=Parascaris univalens TaxID=6257 RepID=A0A915BD86_PARUN